jgi:hypothetical protein
MARDSKFFKDILGIPLNIEDSVFDYTFQKKGIVKGFKDEYVLVDFNFKDTKTTTKLPWNLINLKAHEIVFPEYFI